jgi:Family of unknown function (DUF5367)
MFYLNVWLVTYGCAIWLAATIGLRIVGQRLLHPGAGMRTVILFAITFVVIAWVVRRLCSRLKLPRDQWPMGAISLLLPTLLLDPFSSAFFPAVFPNIAPEAAGLFGGWIIMCCAGGLVGAIVRR